MYKNKRQLSEKELTEKLKRTLIAIVSIIAALVILLTFFAPKIGAFFWFFSKNKNQPVKHVSLILTPPVLVNAPRSTKEPNITLSGISQRGTTVKIYVNGPEAGVATTSSDGVFIFPDIKLNPGNNLINLLAINNEGIISDKSQDYNIALDNEKPKIEISSPRDKETIKNLDKRIFIGGKVNEDATVKINDKHVIVNSDKSFEFLLGVSEGEVTIKIEAVDTAGNKEEKTMTVYYRKESN